MKVLVTGAASPIARGVVGTLRGHHDLRLLDVRRPDEPGDDPWVVGSILDPAALDEALEGIDAVLNFVVVRSDDTGEMFDVNVKGLYLLLEAAAARDVRRFVHVSSTAPVIGHWYAGRPVTVASPPTTRGRYSLCKWLQEQVCEHVARNESMRIVALRPWMPCDGPTVTDDAGRTVRREYAAGLIDTRDFGEACRLALEADLPGAFEVFHTVATREARRRFDADRTESVLGFRAAEDFESLREGGAGADSG
jgi:nucleoside-diphosphate-sugar epimerase